MTVPETNSNTPGKFLTTEAAKNIPTAGPPHLTMEYLLRVMQDLSATHDEKRVWSILCRAARDITGADGAAIALREGDQCLYAEESSTQPLWKGRRFPIGECLSGRAMLSGEAVVIPDVENAPRLPAEMLRGTFVKSLVVVPIRTLRPIGAIGAYWAVPRQVTPDELKALQTLAENASLALENVRLHVELEERIRASQARVEAAQKELEAFSYSVSHELRAPLQGISGYAEILQRTHAAQLDEKGKLFVDRMIQSCWRMAGLIDELLGLSRITLAPLQSQSVDLAELAKEIAAALQAGDPERPVQFVIADSLPVQGDPDLLRVALKNLFNNAWKFTGKTSAARIEFGSLVADGKTVYRIRDNGVGFDPQHAGRLFGVFQRLHLECEFPGTGLGLAATHRIIQKHNGRIWAEGAMNEGAVFYFILG